ncbi:TPA: DUF2591 family protein [Enterobacter roggenkampii]|nr:DUF2591 family protein [Enterobacter roggenkampii]
MDYSKLSDKEVNRKVQIASRLIGSLTGRGVLIVRDGKWEFFDPCNNPADAWPIITANKISIYAMSEADKRGGWGAEAFHPNDAYSFNDNRHVKAHDSACPPVYLDGGKALSPCCP